MDTNEESENNKSPHNDVNDFCKSLPMTNNRNNMHFFKIINENDISEKLILSEPDVDSIQIVSTNLNTFKMESSFQLDFKFNSIERVSHARKLFRQMYDSENEKMFDNLDFYSTPMGNITFSNTRILLYIAVHNKLISDESVNDIKNTMKFNIIPQICNNLRYTPVTFDECTTSYGIKIKTVKQPSSKSDKFTFKDVNATLQNKIFVIKDEWNFFAKSLSNALNKLEKDYSKSKFQFIHSTPLIEFFFGVQEHGLRMINKTKVMDWISSTINSNELNKMTSNIHVINDCEQQKNDENCVTVLNNKIQINLDVAVEMKSKNTNNSVIIDLKKFEEQFSLCNSKLQKFNHSLGLEQYGYLSIDKIRINSEANDYSIIDFINSDNVLFSKKCPFSFFNNNVINLKMYDNCYKLLTNVNLHPWISCLTNNFGESSPQKLTEATRTTTTKTTARTTRTNIQECNEIDNRNEVEEEGEENSSTEKKSYKFQEYYNSLSNKKNTYIMQTEEYIRTREKGSITRLELTHGFTTLQECFQFLNELETSDKWTSNIKSFITHGDNHHDKNTHRHHHHHPDKNNSFHRCSCNSNEHDTTNDYNVNELEIYQEYKNETKFNNYCYNKAKKCDSDYFKVCSDYGFVTIAGYNITIDASNRSVTTYSQYLKEKLICRFQFESLLLSFVNDSTDECYSFNSYHLMKTIGSDFLNVLNIVHNQILYYTRGIKAADVFFLSENTFNGNFDYSYFNGILHWKNDNIFAEIQNIIDNEKMTKYTKILKIFEIDNFYRYYVPQDYDNMFEKCQLSLHYYDTFFNPHLLHILYYIIKSVCKIQLTTVEQKCSLFTYCIIYSLAAYSFLTLNICQKLTDFSNNISDILTL